MSEHTEKFENSFKSYAMFHGGWAAFRCRYRSAANATRRESLLKQIEGTRYRRERSENKSKQVSLRRISMHSNNTQMINIHRVLNKEDYGRTRMCTWNSFWHYLAMWRSTMRNSALKQKLLFRCAYAVRIRWSRLWEFCKVFPSFFKFRFEAGRCREKFAANWFA